MSSPEQKKALDASTSPLHNEGETEATNGAGVEPDMGNIDKIRDILFGGQMRDYDRRFSRVEEQLVKESLELREDTRKRFEALEAFVKAELAALTDRLQAEQRTRDDAVSGLWRGVHESSQALSARSEERRVGKESRS